jgi:hypothetical protein
MIHARMDKGTKENSLQTRQSPWQNSIFSKIKIKFYFNPIDKPQEPHEEKRQCDYRIGVFKMVVVHVVI